MMSLGLSPEEVKEKLEKWTLGRQTNTVRLTAQDTKRQVYRKERWQKTKAENEKFQAIEVSDEASDV